MDYLIQEITLYLAVAFIIGVIYGWVIRGIRDQGELTSHLDRHEKELQQLRSENTALKDRVEQLELIPASGGAEDWQDEYSISVIEDIEPSTLSKLADQNIKTTKQLWKFCDSEDKVYDLAAKIGVEDFAPFTERFGE